MAPVHGAHGVQMGWHRLAVVERGQTRGPWTARNSPAHGRDHYWVIGATFPPIDDVTSRMGIPFPLAWQDGGQVISPSGQIRSPAVEKGERGRAGFRRLWKERGCGARQAQVHR
jgi:hypothetical protein